MGENRKKVCGKKNLGKTFNVHQDGFRGQSAALDLKNAILQDEELSPQIENICLNSATWWTIVIQTLDTFDKLLSVN